jgi:hypothetical protein
VGWSAVAPLVCDAGRLLYNHGGSADDLARPGLVSLPAPASTYFDGAVQEAVARQVERLMVARSPGPFAQAAAAGYLAHAAHRQGLAAESPRQWTTSTLLGDFTLDDGWHQVGHRVRTIRWRHGRMVPVGQAPADALGLD